MPKLSGVHVLPSRTVPAFTGVVKAGETLPSLPLVDIRVALETRYPIDAHVAPYCVVDQTGNPIHEIPRLRKTALSWIRENRCDVVLTHVFIDIDRAGHSPWESEQQIHDEVQRTLSVLPEARNCGWYATQSGYRLVWGLPEAIPADRWKGFVTQFIRHLRNHGIEADPVSRVWNTTYRLPHIQKSAGVPILDLPKDFSRMGDLEWVAPDPVETESASHNADDLEFPTEAPRVLPPSAEDLALLEGSEFYDRLRTGKPLGEPGTRRSSILRCAGQVATILRTADAERVYRVLLPSVISDTSGTNAQGKTDPAPSPAEAWQLCCFVARRQAAKMDQQDAERSALLSGLHRNQASGGELVEDISNRLILMHATSLYVLNERSGEYAGPYLDKEMDVAIRENCPSLIWVRDPADGKMLDRRHILHLHGKVVGGVFLEMGRTKNWYNACTNTLHMGICRIRPDLAPAYDAEVDTWLRLLGGADADRLLDWLATVTDLRKPTCALYLQGHPGSGKGMLAEGVGRLWAPTASRYEDFVSNFNDSIEHCPVLWADERIPTSKYGNTPSATIRTLVGNASFVLRKKFLPTVPVTGCLRLVVSANNADALGIRETLTEDDYAAIVERVGHVTCSDKARAYIESLGGRTKTETWIAGDKLPRHILWLRDNHKVQRPGARFLVDGWETELHRHISTRAGCTEEVLESIAYAINSGMQADGLFVGDGRICVSVNCLQRIMPAALGVSYVLPRRNALAISLRALSEPTEAQVRVHVNGVFHRVWNLRVSDVASFADGAGFCEQQTILSRAATVVGRSFYAYTK